MEQESLGPVQLLSGCALSVVAVARDSFFSPGFNCAASGLAGARLGGAVVYQPRHPPWNSGITVFLGQRFVRIAREILLSWRSSSGTRTRSESPRTHMNARPKETGAAGADIKSRGWRPESCAATLKCDE